MRCSVSHSGAALRGALLCIPIQGEVLGPRPSEQSAAMPCLAQLRDALPCLVPPSEAFQGEGFGPGTSMIQRFALCCAARSCRVLRRRALHRRAVRCLPIQGFKRKGPPGSEPGGPWTIRIWLRLGPGRARKGSGKIQVYPRPAGARNIRRAASPIRHPGGFHILQPFSRRVKEVGRCLTSRFGT
jgi:hypothetical protein